MTGTSPSWLVRGCLFTWCCASEVVLDRGSWGLLPARAEVACCYGNDEEHHNYDTPSHVAQVIFDRTNIGRTSAVDTCITLAFATRVTYIEVLFHAIQTYCHGPRAVSEGAAVLHLTVLVRGARLHTADHVRTSSLPAASRQALKAVLTVIESLLPPSVAYTSWNATSLTAAEGRLSTVVVHQTLSADLLLHCDRPCLNWRVCLERVEQLTETHHWSLILPCSGCGGKYGERDYSFSHINYYQ